MPERYARSRVKGFLHTDGRIMRNGEGEEILLCGWGAGNWLNPEGFLCGDLPREWGQHAQPTDPPARFERARSIEDSVRLLCGTDYASSFWKRWYRIHLAEADLRAMAEYGYNSVRLPLNARAFLPEEPGYQWNEDTFQVLDQIIDWCEQYRLYAFLDMHTVPGGQSGIKCDDGLDSVPRFFQEEESQERTIQLWEKLAERYRDRWIIGGYDLLNEPLATLSSMEFLPLLERFYDQLIERIRKIDQQHMLTIEGARAATDMRVFHRDYDSKYHNWCIHMHFYGYTPEERSLYRCLEASMRLNVPVWMGEGGGHQTDMAALCEVFRKFDIGYNLWCWKVSTFPDGRLRRDPVQYRLPADWNKILACLNEGAPRPTYAECQTIFDEMLGNMAYEHCIINSDIHRLQMMGPGRTWPAAAYDVCGDRPFNGNWNFGNEFEFRTEDQMHLVRRSDSTPPIRAMRFDTTTVRPTRPLEYLDLCLEEGDWASYSLINGEQPCNISADICSADNCMLEVRCGSTVRLVTIHSSNAFTNYPLLTFPSGTTAAVQIRAIKGTVILREIHYSGGQT